VRILQQYSKDGATMKKLMISLMSLALLSQNVIAANAPSVQPEKPPYNIILIINDQETYHLATAAGYQLPARQMLKDHGVEFENHYTAAAMCSPSRATFLTGIPPQKNGVFDQMEYSFVADLNTKWPTIGTVLKKLGYHTVYFGKLEMTKTLLEDKNTVNYSTLAKSYGFDVFNSNGDVNSSPQEGYSVDTFTAGEAVQWLRKNADKKHAQPFFLVVSLLNPHDIMYGDANLPGQPLIQQALAPVILPPPANSIYAQNWQFSLTPTLQESLTASGIPNALFEYQKGWSVGLGEIPTDKKDMWHYYYNYYLNALRDNDRSLLHVVNTINEMNLWKNTVIIMTADHGEMGGSHGGLRGKGPMAYEENTHIPLIIDDPQGLHGIKNIALTSHLDLLPTIVGLTSLPENQRKTATQSFAGKDFSSQVMTQNSSDLHAVRPAILFNYVGISTIDGSYLGNLLKATFTNQTLPSLSQVDMSKRGFLAVIFDGRYKYARFYAPNAFNMPDTLTDIFKYNDVQLFDLQTDPNETQNLALAPEKNKELILRLNHLLNSMIKNEVGENNGSFLPASIQSNVHTVNLH
jgi:arylsulfatase A-like enzyme